MQHLQGNCYLDNSPFVSNQDQIDLNGDGEGDVGLGITQTGTGALT